jgi:phosphate regulon transcriptional regulator PhoB
MKPLIAIVDDEPDILELLSYNLKKENFEVEEFSNSLKFLDWIKKNKPNLIILDLMIPDVDGIEICKILKKDERTAKIPIIMLTAKGSETDKVLGLELGADDYIVKPFSIKELIARVKAVLRRINTNSQKESIKRIDELLIDSNKFEVKIGEKKIDLTTTEFKILSILLERPGWVFSREQLLDRLWEGDKIVIDRTIDVHITQLRKKLGKYGQFIKSIRGVGYKFEK